jgi:hypothetical protein
MYEVLWPRGRKVDGLRSLANRFDNLEGRTIGELWNRDFHGDEIFPTLEIELTTRYPGIKFISYEKFAPSHGANEAGVLAALPDNLAENGCEAVISGMGC